MDTLDKFGVKNTKKSDGKQRYKAFDISQNRENSLLEIRENNQGYAIDTNYTHAYHYDFEEEKHEIIIYSTMMRVTLHGHDLHELKDKLMNKSVAWIEVYNENIHLRSHDTAFISSVNFAEIGAPES